MLVQVNAIQLEHVLSMPFFNESRFFLDTSKLVVGGAFSPKCDMIFVEHEPAYPEWKAAVVAAGGVVTSCEFGGGRGGVTSTPQCFVYKNNTTGWLLLDAFQKDITTYWTDPKLIGMFRSMAFMASDPSHMTKPISKVLEELLERDAAFLDILVYTKSTPSLLTAAAPGALLASLGYRPYDCKVHTLHAFFYTTISVARICMSDRVVPSPKDKYELLSEMPNIRSMMNARISSETAMVDLLKSDFEATMKLKLKAQKKKNVVVQREAAHAPLVPTAAAATKALKLLEAEYAAASKAARTAVAAVSIGSAAAKEARVARKVVAEQAQCVAKGKLDCAKHQLKQVLAAPPAAASGRREPMDALAGREAGGAAGGASGGDHFEADAALARAMQAELDAAADSDEYDTSCSVCMDAEPTVSSACCANIQVCTECAAKLRTCMQCRCEGVVFVAL